MLAGVQALMMSSIRSRRRHSRRCAYAACLADALGALFDEWGWEATLYDGAE